jgi:hypothetical protein
MYEPLTLLKTAPASVFSVVSYGQMSEMMNLLSISSLAAQQFGNGNPDSFRNVSLNYQHSMQVRTKFYGFWAYTANKSTPCFYQHF